MTRLQEHDPVVLNDCLRPPSFGVWVPLPARPQGPIVDLQHLHGRALSVAESDATSHRGADDSNSGTVPGEQGPQLVRFLCEDLLQLLEDISGYVEMRRRLARRTRSRRRKRDDRLGGATGPVASSGPSVGALEQFAPGVPGHVHRFELNRGGGIEAEVPEQRASHPHRILVELLVEQDLDPIGAEGLQEGGELPGIASHADVVPDVVPATADPFLLPAERIPEVVTWLQASGPLVRVRGECPSATGRGGWRRAWPQGSNCWRVGTERSA